MSNPLRDAIGDAASLGLLIGAEVVGIQGTYNHEGTDIDDIYALPLESVGRMRLSINIRMRELKGAVLIPKQDNFPPADGVMEDDTWTDDNGVVYRVDEDNSDPFNVVYLFTVVNSIAKQVGGDIGQ
jgi:hypothetical protein